MFEKDVEQLVEQMSSFYREYLPIDSSYEKLLAIYIQSFLSIWREATYFKDHIVLEDAPTLKSIDYSKIDITEALYDKSKASQLLLLPTFEEQIKELDKIRGFITFEFSELGNRTPEVYDMTLKARFADTDSLTLYDEYFIRNNKLYILPGFVLRGDIITKELHAFNIRVDNFMIEKKWGSLFDLETGPLLPRSQYRDVISAIRRLLSSNLTIRDMKEALTLATGWEEFDIQDRLTPGLNPSLRRLYDEWRIAPSRFIATLPEELIADKIRLNILLSVLDEAKEEHLNYLILFGIIREEMQGEKMIDSNLHRISTIATDYTNNQDVVNGDIKQVHHDYFFADNRYDFGKRYEVTMVYDTNIEKDTDFSMDGGQFFEGEPVNSFEMDGSSFAEDEDDHELDVNGGGFPDVDTFNYFTDGGNFPDTSSTDVVLVDAEGFITSPDEEMELADGGAFVESSVPVFINEQPWDNRAEYVSVRNATFPEIPRQFSIIKVDEENIEVSVRPNTDKTETFEILASTEEYLDFVNVGVITNNNLSTENSLILNANVLAKRYYKVRAISGTHLSLSTLPVDIETL